MVKKKREAAWTTRLRDLLLDFKAAKERCQLRFVLIQTTGADVKDLLPSDPKIESGSGRASVTLGDVTPAQRLFYRLGPGDDPAVALIERGNDILNRHGHSILKLFGLKFIRTFESNWLWLLATLADVEHPFRGDIKADRELAGYLSPKEMREAFAFQDGRGPKPNWWDKKHQSFRADIPHVAVASIAAIRAILERVDANAAETPGDKRQTPKVDGPLQPDGFCLNGIEVWGLAEDWQDVLTFVCKQGDPPKWQDVATHLGVLGEMTDAGFRKLIHKINGKLKDYWPETLQTVTRTGKGTLVVLRKPTRKKGPSRKSPTKKLPTKKVVKQKSKSHTAKAVAVPKSTRNKRATTKRH